MKPTVNFPISDTTAVTGGPSDQINYHLGAALKLVQPASQPLLDHLIRMALLEVAKPTMAHR